MASSFLCDLDKGDTVDVTGPFGATFLMPNIPDAKLLLICTGTGSAPMRAFTMQCLRMGLKNGNMSMFFGARTKLAALFRGAQKEMKDAVARILTPAADETRRARRICLLGLRGAGKSTLGSLAGEALGLPFVELNSELEVQSGMPVGEVMAL